MNFKQFSDISDYKNWVKIEEINKGYSRDKKYYIMRSDGTQLILRTSDISEYDKRRNEAIFAQLVFGNLKLNMNVPIEIAACCNDTLVYSLSYWVEGEDATAVTSRLPAPEQVKLGEKAGKILKQIHTICAPEDIEPWENSFGRTIDRKLNGFKNCGLDFDGSDKIINYINENRSLINGRQQFVLHGDFRLGNMVIDKNMNIGIIDFNRCRYGDPLNEFDFVVHADEAPFTKGMIKEYFKDGMDPDFFRLNLLYTAVNVLGAIDWAVREGIEPKEYIDDANRLIWQYNGLSGHIPNWY